MRTRRLNLSVRPSFCLFYPRFKGHSLMYIRCSNEHGAQSKRWKYSDCNGHSKIRKSVEMIKCKFDTFPFFEVLNIQ